MKIDWNAPCAPPAAPVPRRPGSAPAAHDAGGVPGAGQGLRAVAVFEPPGVRPRRGWGWGWADEGSRPGGGSPAVDTCGSMSLTWKPVARGLQPAPQSAPQQPASQESKRTSGRLGMALALLLALVWPMAPATGSGEPLGRLFFTPAERARLERAKHAPPVLVATPAAPAGPVTFNGYIRPSRGAPTLWINRQSVEAGKLPSAARLTPAGAALTLRMGERDLKPGQVLDPSSGAVLEPYLVRERQEPEVDSAAGEAPAGEPYGEDAAGESVTGAGAGQ